MKPNAGFIEMIQEHFGELKDMKSKLLKWELIMDITVGLSLDFQEAMMQGLLEEGFKFFQKTVPIVTE